MTDIEQLAIQVKRECKAIDDVTDFAIKEFINKFFDKYLDDAHRTKTPDNNSIYNLAWIRYE